MIVKFTTPMQGAWSFKMHPLRYAVVIALPLMFLITQLWRIDCLWGRLCVSLQNTGVFAYVAPKTSAFSSSLSLHCQQSAHIYIGDYFWTPRYGQFAGFSQVKVLPWSAIIPLWIGGWLLFITKRYNPRLMRGFPVITQVHHDARHQGLGRHDEVEPCRQSDLLP
jgi:hypothetical protein